MKFAKGTRSLIFFPFILQCLFIIFFIIFMDELISVVFIFIAFFLFLLTCFFILFFRDPDRIIGKGIVACADGKIREILNLKDEDIGDCLRISTFMNIYNVHVNRMPIDGIIKNVVHPKGLHLPAFKKDSDKNERVITIIETKIGKIKIVQIAGTLARRIVPYIKKEDKLKKGEKIGIIRLGSRLDLYLPSKGIKKITVNVGDMIKAGEDSIAEIND